MRKSNKTKFDYLSSLYASKGLAREIEKYWKDKGYPNVSAWVEKVEDIFVVRSNIKFRM